jgi:acyl-CoA reductase-like NAD-dependent aldehyde dehydrogenase
LDAAAGETFDSINPSTCKLITRTADGGAEDINLAVRAGREAFEGPWRKFTPVEPQNKLLRFADLIEKYYQELLLIDAHDMGSPVGIARPLCEPRRAGRAMITFSMAARASFGSGRNNRRARNAPRLARYL